MARSHTVAGIELVAPERGPHACQGTEQLSASVPGRGGPEEGSRLPQPPAVPLAPSGLAAALGFFSPASCPSLEEDLSLGGAAGPGRHGWGVCAALLTLCFCASFPAVCTAVTRFSKVAAVGQDCVALTGTRSTGAASSSHCLATCARRAPPLPRMGLQGQLRAATSEAAAWVPRRNGQQGEESSSEGKKTG